MFFPCASNNFDQLSSSSSTPQAPGFSYFSCHTLSRKLYRLKFEVQIFNKCMMHIFYVMTSLVLINSVHILLRMSTVQNNAFFLSNMRVSEVRNIGKKSLFAIITKCKTCSKCCCVPSSLNPYLLQYAPLPFL